MSNTTRLQWSSIQHILQEIRPPFPLAKNSNNLLITFNLKFRTQQFSIIPKTEKFVELHNCINALHTEGMGNKHIAEYLNSQNIKTATGREHTRHSIGMYFYKSRKIKRRLKHSELKLSNIRFFTY